MKKVLFLALSLLCFTASAANADIVFSTSATDANAGSDFTFQEGQTGQIYVWVSTEAGQTINGLSLDILSSDANVLEATAHTIENPVIIANLTRWGGTGAGDLGDLVNDSNAVGLGGIGLNTGGLSNFVLHSTVDVLATGVGTTNLSFAEGNNLITDDQSVGSIADTINFGGGSVTVNAVPEPSTFFALGVATIGFGAYQLRRRRAAKKA